MTNVFSHARLIMEYNKKQWEAENNWNNQYEYDEWGEGGSGEPRQYQGDGQHWDPHQQHTPGSR